MTFRSLPALTRVYLAGIALAALASSLPALAHLRADERWTTFAVFAAGAAVLQLASGHASGPNHRLDTAIVFVAAAAFVLPPELVALMGIAQHGLDGIRRRYPWFAQLFNIANGTLSALAAWGTHRLLVDADARGAVTVIGGLTAGAALVCVNHVLLAFMVKLGNRRSFRSTGLLSIENLAMELVPAGLGLALATFWTTNRWLAVVAVAPMLLQRRTFVLLGRLTESEERFRAMFDSAAVGVALLELDGRIVTANRALEAALGYGDGELVGRAYAELSPTDESEEELRAELVTGGRAQYHVEKLYTGRDGRTMFGGASVTLVRDARDKPRYAIAMIQDVTERKELEEQLRQSQKMEAVGRLAGGIAHDFNNVLTAITGYSELGLLRIDAGLPMPREEVAEISKAADRAAALTRQLLAFSRKQVLQPRVLDLCAIVRDTENMLRRLIGENVSVYTSFDPDGVTTRADVSQLQQILVNLAVNARDAMAGNGGGRLEIEVRRMQVDVAEAARLGVADGAYAMLRVGDDGCGMSAETQSRIFEPFFTTKANGTGLGLATVYGVVHQSGGAIQIDSEVGSGTTCRILLPLVEAPARPSVASEGSREESAETATVLLVEDDEAVRTMIREVLRADGHEVVEASNGDEALRVHELNREAIDLVVTDVVMPGLGGFELAEQIAAAAPATRVLFISGYVAERAGTALEDDTHFLQKPFTPTQLRRKLTEVFSAERMAA